MIPTLGTLFFAFSGYVMALPNIAVLIQNRERMEKSIITSMTLLFLLYAIVGCVPFILLNKYVIEESIVSTLARIAETPGYTSFRVSIKLVETFVTLHFLVTILPIMNPVYLVIEAYLNFPPGKSCNCLTV